MSRALRSIILTACTALALVQLPGEPAHAGEPGLDARMATAWRALHPKQPLPEACGHRDPVRVLDVHLGGGEVATAMASRRFGLILVGKKGPLAALEVGCGDPRYADDDSFPQVVSLAAMAATGRAPEDLALRLRDVGHCGTVDEIHLVTPTKGHLEEALVAPVEVTRECRQQADEESRATLTIVAPGRLRVSTAGKMRDWQGEDLGPWKSFTRVEEFRLVGTRFEPVTGGNR